MRRAVEAFSLVEVVLALGVIGFALIAIISLLPTGLQSGRASVQETRANHLAEEIFTTLRSQSFKTVSLSNLSNTSTIDLSLSGTTQLHATYEGDFSTTADYFTIDVTFVNNPVGLNSGTASEVHLRITSRETGAPPFNYATIVANQ